MSSAELADVLDEMADKLRDIRRHDEGGWTAEARMQIYEAEAKLRLASLWFEQR